MSALMRRRWSDSDTYLGPFTYARDNRGRPLAIVLCLGDEEYPGATFRISAIGHTVIVALPARVLRPSNHGSREYGLSISDGHLSVFYGRQTMDSSTEQRWGYFLPWTQWRHVRRSFYGIQGEHIATLPDAVSLGTLGNRDRWARECAIADATPTVSFKFQDFDGEQITATTKIEEREWRFGTGAFKWLSMFRPPKIRRSLDIRFSAEVGPRKGSWKGGTLGHGIDMASAELHEQAFKRYCAQNNLTFGGAA